MRYEVYLTIYRVRKGIYKEILKRVSDGEHREYRDFGRYRREGTGM